MHVFVLYSPYKLQILKQWSTGMRLCSAHAKNNLLKYEDEPLQRKNVKIKCHNRFPCTINSNLTNPNSTPKCIVCKPAWLLQNEHETGDWYILAPPHRLENQEIFLTSHGLRPWMWITIWKSPRRRRFSSFGSPNFPLFLLLRMA